MCDVFSLLATLLPSMLLCNQALLLHDTTFDYASLPPLWSDAHADSCHVFGLVLWVFPCLRKHAIVPINIVGVESQLALLGVLLNWGGRLILQCVCAVNTALGPTL